jgi:hypothetical protein
MQGKVGVNAHGEPAATAVRAARSVGGCFLGAPAALAAFGLGLALLTSPSFSSRPAYELAAASIAAAVGLAKGGYVVGGLAGRQRALHVGIFGLFLGLFGFSYLLGPGWAVLTAGLACAGLGVAGGWMASTRRPPAGTRRAGRASLVSASGS